MWYAAGERYQPSSELYETTEARSPVRWKLLIAASLLAALVGAGACLLVARLLTDGPAGAAWAVLLLPLGAVAAASVFVYRHTARRRALQAMATALLASLLTLTGLVAGSILTGRTRSGLLPIESKSSSQ